MTIPKKQMSSISEVLKKYEVEKEKKRFISQEFQKYGYDLAVELGDLAHKSLYIKLAKTTPREVLEKARHFVRDAHNAKSRARLFMWKVKQLKASKN